MAYTPDGPYEYTTFIVDQTAGNLTEANGVITLLGADGGPWKPQAGDVTVTSDDITDATTVGKDVLTASSASAARSAIGAGTSSFSGAYSDLTGKPTLGTASTKATGFFATAAQGAKADSATQPGDLTPYAKTADLALSGASVAANVATGGTVDDVIASLIAAGLMASA